MFMRNCVALAVFAVASTLAQAQARDDTHAADEVSGGDSAPPLQRTLDEALDSAARNNPALRGARADSNASSGALMQAGARPNPELSFLQEGIGGTERTTTALVNQRVERGGKRGARLEVASYGRQAAEAAVEEAGAAVRADVVSAFYGLLAAQRQWQVTQESAEIAARSADIAARRAKAGKVSPVEAIKAQAAAAAVRIDVANARRTVDIAREKLNVLTGWAGPDRCVVTGDLEAIRTAPPLAVLAARLDDAPGARMARADMLRSSASISLERAKRMPDITISAGMKRIVTGGARDNQAVVGVTIPLPLFDTNKGALLEAVHKAERASADLDRENARLRLALTQAYANYEGAINEAQRLRTDMLPAARQALGATQRGYALGKFSLLDVLDAQRTLFQAQLQYLRALADAHVARADIDRIIGTPLTAGAQTAVSSR